MVISAIDAMATFLTGERYYFSADGSVGERGNVGASGPESPRERREALAYVTYFVAMPFDRNEDGELVAGEAQDRQSAGAAESAARRMAETAAGAVAFSRTGDPADGASSRTRWCCAGSARCRAWTIFWAASDMPVYRLEIERGDTLWVTAHDERGAIEMASAHLGEEPALEKTMVQLKHDADDALILRAMAGQWPPIDDSRGQSVVTHEGHS